VATEVVLRSRTPQETQTLAATLAGMLRPGDVVALTGELGAGKTCFVQGAAAALGVTERVTSPSFMLRREYDGDVPILHMDIYRLETFQEIVDIGYEEVYDLQRVTFIEWGDAMSPLLPRDHLELEFRLPPVDAPPVAGDEERRIVVRPRGDDWRRRIAELRARLEPWVDGADSAAENVPEGPSTAENGP
jgi:tRNA threonylcarbamoyladenosine biosynthesis protein TsaE